MLRQLLTLLAVISGFTLAAEPVSAAEARMVSVAAEEALELASGIVAAPLHLAQPADERAGQAALPRPARVVAYATPAVRLKADRARE